MLDAVFIGKRAPQLCSSKKLTYIYNLFCKPYLEVLYFMRWYFYPYLFYMLRRSMPDYLFRIMRIYSMNILRNNIKMQLFSLTRWQGLTMQCTKHIPVSPTWFTKLIGNPWLFTSRTDPWLFSYQIKLDKA